MFKFLIFLILLAGSSLFVTEVFSLEIELQKESDRIIESKGWLMPEERSLREHLQIIIDQREFQNRISVGLLSKDPNDIKLPDNLEAISSNPKISSMVITNEFACAPNKIDKGCVIIEIEIDGLGDNLNEMKNTAREIADEIVADGVIVFSPEFYSSTFQPKGGLSVDEAKRLGEKGSVARVVYTVHKQPTNELFTALSNLLLSNDIRTSGGFYNIAEKLSENYFSEFTVTMIPLENEMLRELHISLLCSDERQELVNCDRLYDALIPGDQVKIDEQIARGDISPLNIMQIENISRSKIFLDEFLPLNSVIQVLILSEEDLQVKSVNSNLIENLQNLGDIQESGWFFTSKAGQTIDARYIFGHEPSVSKNDLVFSIGSYSENDIEIKEVEYADGDGGCLIATAAFGSEMAPQVQLLREIRDNTVLQTESGTSFMTGFNQFYYSFSPTVADYERENPTFKEAVKLTLTPLLTSLTLLQYADIDSEPEMFGYGIGVILLNIGMYFVAPAVLIMTVRKRI